MDGSDEGRRDTTWGRDDAWPTAKQRTGVQHAVRRVLDALAPEPTPRRGAEPPTDLQRYRFPSGCILQGDAAAVSVSWFTTSAASEPTFGELHVIAWSGVVSRPGASRRAAGGARLVAAELLRPVERSVEASGDSWSWRAADGTVLDTATVVARCLALLAAQQPSLALAGTP